MKRTVSELKADNQHAAVAHDSTRTDSYAKYVELRLNEADQAASESYVRFSADEVFTRLKARIHR